MEAQRKTGMTSCSWGTEGQEATRTLVFNGYMCVEENGKGTVAGCARQ